MRILFLEWDSYSSDYIKKEMIRRGNNVIIMSFPHNDNTRGSEALASKIAIAALDNRAEMIFSLNYFPVVAIAANACKIKYVSWTYDSPYIQIYSKTIELPTNYAFVFDKSEYMKLKSLGIETVYYLPMASTTEEYDKVELLENDKIFFDADVAMIGSMYSEKKHLLMRHFDKIDDYTRGYVDGIIMAQKQVFGADIMEPALTDDIVKNIQKSAPMIESGDGFEKLNWTFSKYFLARELTRIERYEYIKALSEMCKVTLYTYESVPGLPQVINKGPLDYYSAMPKAIKCAKINLNISLRSIVTGIPLRIMDILGCGGFLMTDYRDDMLDYFVPDEDFVYYDSKVNLLEKCKYYLEHTEERIRIAKNGYEKAKKYHSLSQRLDYIEQVVNNAII